MSDSVGSVSVEVVPDARNWSERLRAQIRNVTATVNVDADTGEAAAQIDEVARDRKATIEVSTDRSSISSAESGIAGMVKNVSLLPALFIAAGAAAVPLAATVGGIVAALAAPLAIAGGGAGLFAVLGGLAVKQTEKQLKNVDTLQKKLGGLTKGTATYNATLQQLNSAQSALTPAQVKFAASTDKLKLSFQGLLAGRNGQALLGPITQGIDALAKILPAAEPLIRSVSGAFSLLLTQLSRATSGPGFDKFVRMFSRQAGGDIVGFGHIIGNITTGLGGLFGALDRQAGHGLVDELGHLTGEFSDWANSKAGRQDVREFLDYFHKVGPGVASAIGAVARAIGHLVSALAPLGPPVLRIVQGIANAISGIPTGTLTALLAVTAGVSVAAYGAKKIDQTRGFLANIPGAGGLGSVQKVYVTNPGFGSGTGSISGKLGEIGLVLAGLEAGRVATNLGYKANVTDFGKKFADTTALAALPFTHTLPSGVTSGPSQASINAQNKGTLQADLAAAFAYYHAHGNVPDAALKSIGFTDPSQVRAQFNLPQLKSTSNILDVLKAHAQQASRGFDLIGHSAAANSASAVGSISSVQKALSALHDKRVNISANTAAAVRGLQLIYEAENRLHDRTLTIYQRNQNLDQVGGRHQATPGGSGGSSGGSSGGAGRTQVHVHLDDSGRATLSGYMEHSADTVYHANRDYENSAAGR